MTYHRRNLAEEAQAERVATVVDDIMRRVRLSIAANDRMDGLADPAGACQRIGITLQPNMPNMRGFR